MQTGRSENLTRCGLIRSGHRLAVSGEIDEANASALGKHIGAAFGTGVTVVDLSEVTFFSAAGLRAVLGLGPIATRHGVDVRVRCSPQVWRVVELCGIPSIGGLLLEPPRRPPTEGGAP